jgi:hypothetical protein
MARRPHTDPLPGVALVRIKADPEATERLLSVLKAYFTCTSPREYPGGEASVRSYIDVDTRPIAPSHPEAD